MTIARTFFTRSGSKTISEWLRRAVAVLIILSLHGCAREVHHVGELNGSMVVPEDQRFTLISSFEQLPTAVRSSVLSALSALNSKMVPYGIANYGEDFLSPDQLPNGLPYIQHQFSYGSSSWFVVSLLAPKPEAPIGVAPSYSGDNVKPYLQEQYVLMVLADGGKACALHYEARLWRPNTFQAVFTAIGDYFTAPVVKKAFVLNEEACKKFQGFSEVARLVGAL